MIRLGLEGETKKSYAIHYQLMDLTTSYFF